VYATRPCLQPAYVTTTWRLLACAFNYPLHANLINCSLWQPVTALSLLLVLPETCMATQPIAYTVKATGANALLMYTYVSIKWLSSALLLALCMPFSNFLLYMCSHDLCLYLSLQTSSIILYSVLSHCCLLTLWNVTEGWLLWTLFPSCEPGMTVTWPLFTCLLLCLLPAALPSPPPPQPAPLTSYLCCCFCFLLPSSLPAFVLS